MQLCMYLFITCQLVFNKRNEEELMLIFVVNILSIAFCAILQHNGTNIMNNNYYFIQMPINLLSCTPTITSYDPRQPIGHILCTVHGASPSSIQPKPITVLLLSV